MINILVSVKNIVKNLLYLVNCVKSSKVYLCIECFLKSFLWKYKILISVKELSLKMFKCLLLVFKIVVFFGY